MGKALIGLSTYEGENPPKLREKDAPAEPPNFIAGASIAGILMLFFFITVRQPTCNGSNAAVQMLTGYFTASYGVR